MATQITLKGANFGNPLLPAVGNMLRAGLVGAWRFGGGYESAADLSGNKATLTEKGKVSFTEHGVVGDLDNGFVSSLPETTDRTFIAVFRVPASVADITAHHAMVVGNFTDGSESAGGSIWLTGYGASNTRQLRNLQHYYDSTAVETNSHGLSSVGPNFESDADHVWLFVAASIDSGANKTACYSPTLKGYNAGVEYQEKIDANLRFSTRTLSSNPLEIISIPDSNWGRGYESVVEVSEVLVYDRALGIDELQKAYQYSKEYHKNVKGISI